MMWNDIIVFSSAGEQNECQNVIYFFLTDACSMTESDSDSDEATFFGHLLIRSFIDSIELYPLGDEMMHSVISQSFNMVFSYIQ